MSPSPQVFHRNPEALKREIAHNGMKDWLEDTIIYGEDNALPLRIAKAVDESPAATACIDTIAQYIRGAGFSNKKLERQVINKNGETLWQHHSKLSDILALFNGFAVNLKFNSDGEITNAFDMSFESIRFVKPKEELSTNIDFVKYNPYYGTAEFKKDYSTTYPVYNKARLNDQFAEFGNTFPGQVYYFGKTSPLYRFYPVPKYWSAKKWIYTDGKIQDFHANNLDNGFFQSVLMNMIGDPNQWSNNPHTMVEELQSDGVTKKTVPTKTVGDEFNDMMQANFSGSNKAGNVMALWSLNSDEAVKVQAFPNNTNADLFTTLQDITTKNITIATKVPSILANISEGVSLGSAGSEIQKAIELMQSRVIEWQMALMEYYNNVLLPGMGITDKVEIVNFNPISEPADINDKVWEFLNDEEKADWITKSYPDVTLKRAPVAPVAPVNPDGTPAPVQPPAPTGNSALAGLTMAQLNKIQKIAARFNLSFTQPDNPRALTFEQAKQLLAGYGFTEEDINVWLVTPEEYQTDD